MNRIAFRGAAFALLLALAACSGGEKQGGEAGTPAGNVPEAEPQGVGGTTNQ